jgi:hypothetical protein
MKDHLSKNLTSKAVSTGPQSTSRSSNQPLTCSCPFPIPKTSTLNVFRLENRGSPSKLLKATQSIRSNWRSALSQIVKTSSEIWVEETTESNGKIQEYCELRFDLPQCDVRGGQCSIGVWSGNRYSVSWQMRILRKLVL